LTTLSDNRIFIKTGI